MVLRDPEFQSWLTVSLVVAVASTLLVLVAAVPAAYHTARHRFPGRAAFLFLVLVTQMFAPTALVVGLYREFFELGLINTYTALIAVNAAFNLAFAIWILRAFFASIPREIEEAAAVDGCGRAATLLRVVLPVAAPGIVTAGIFAFIAAWNEYIVALTLMTDASMRPLTVGITSYVTAYVQHWDLLFAASVIAIVPVVVLFALIEPLSGRRPHRRQCEVGSLTLPSPSPCPAPSPSPLPRGERVERGSERPRARPDPGGAAGGWGG